MITNIYLLICAGLFIYINFINQEDKYDCAMKLGAFYPPDIHERKQYWRFVTCHFIHVDFFHFLMNGYALYQLGHFFESLLGPVEYLYLILISMFLSSLLCYSASQISDRYYYTMTIGASGVVYGFFGAIIALGLFVGGPFMSLLQQFMSVIVINLLYTLMNRQISKTGHLGGLIGGIVGIVILLAIQMV
ncbi:rhomboid family intramembrane serine protease [Candidatus Stoquefichus sp. SB1]|jgi:rhomboid protease GluP|uniref:rhomboid family intramembrane serine protease n=1 Tax=Candidatus Stoquefichus sp. SB1 TaxID=1658109 RepID=UPI00067E9C05|nr:rhomboid family intramembrane serine protease [Candidatus Stoquefichus sp. SB1]